MAVPSPQGSRRHRPASRTREDKSTGGVRALGEGQQATCRGHDEPRSHRQPSVERSQVGSDRRRQVGRQDGCGQTFVLPELRGDVTKPERLGRVEDRGSGLLPRLGSS